MRYIPTIVTPENVSWAINKNIQDIERVLKTKAQLNRSLPLPRIDAEGFPVGRVVTSEDTDACTLEKFMELQNG